MVTQNLPSDFFYHLPSSVKFWSYKHAYPEFYTFMNEVKGLNFY